MKFDVQVDNGEVSILDLDGEYETYAHAVYGDPQQLAALLAEVGFGQLSWYISEEDVPIGYIDAVEVDKRARRRGAGSTLMKEVLGILDREGVRQVYLHAQPASHTPVAVLRSFYTSLGFKPIGTFDHYTVYTKGLDTQRNPVDLPRGEWVQASKDELDAIQSSDIWDIYYSTYQVLGLQFLTELGLYDDLEFLWLVDVDGDTTIDAFLAYEVKDHGNKIVLVATDGSKAAKAATKGQLTDLLSSKGWYIEASHALSYALEREGLKPISSERTVVTTLAPKHIEWLGGGKYHRHVTGIGPVVKSLYGRPLT